MPTKIYLSDLGEVPARAEGGLNLSRISQPGSNAIDGDANHTPN